MYLSILIFHSSMQLWSAGA